MDGRGWFGTRSRLSVFAREIRCGLRVGRGAPHGRHATRAREYNGLRYAGWHAFRGGLQRPGLDLQVLEVDEEVVQSKSHFEVFNHRSARTVFAGAPVCR